MHISHNGDYDDSGLTLFSPEAKGSDNLTWEPALRQQ